jgi:thermitase
MEKKMIVVLKQQQESAHGGAEGIMENFSLLKPVYGRIAGEQESEAAAEDELPQLKRLKDEMNRTYTINLDEAGAAELLENLKKENMLERVEEDEENVECFVPNDPNFNKLFGLQKIQAPDVWEQGFTGNGIVVAVVDSGIDVAHPDLQNNLWTGPNGIHGFNVIDCSNNLTDESGHGTHVSGTIAATVNNNIGIAGVAPGCKIMTVKGLSGRFGKGYASTLANCIRLAVDQGARVINNSWGPGNAKEVHQAIEYAFLRKAVVVFAAGNDNREVKRADAAGNALVISVAATDQNDDKSSFSNHGPLVSVAAPGSNILSAVPENGYDFKSGTSMAAPHVSGLAALMLSKNNRLHAGAVKKIIVNTCDPFPQTPQNVIGKGRINAMQAVQAVPFKNSPMESNISSGEPEGGVEILNFQKARDLLLQPFLPEWAKLTTHLGTPAGSHTRPSLPNGSQNLAFKIERQQVLDKVLAGRPKKVACILCFNDNSTGLQHDDSMSVMFAGVNEQERPVTDAAVEKWPGLYKLSDMSTLFAEVLTPTATSSLDMQQFTDAQAIVTIFKNKWLELLDDSDGSVTTPRPGMRRKVHPLVFYITPDEMSTLVNAPNCDSIAGVLGYYEGGGLNFIAPFFVAIDSNKRPVSDIVFTATFVGHAVKNSQFVLDNILTPQ